MRKQSTPYLHLEGLSNPTADDSLGYHTTLLREPPPSPFDNTDERIAQGCISAVRDAYSHHMERECWAVQCSGYPIQRSGGLLVDSRDSVKVGSEY